MSKELEALKDLTVSAMCCGAMEMSLVEKNNAVIEQALKEYERYKVIEKELGIELVTLIKALESPKLWFIWKGTIMDARKINVFFHVDDKRVWFRFSGEFMPKVGYSFAEYGKTWALTREELENGR